MMSYIERLENHIIEMYKNGRIEIAEFNSIKDIIDNLKRCISNDNMRIDMLKSAIENLLDI